MKNIERNLRKMMRYEVPHAQRVHGDCVDDIRIIAPFDQRDTFFLKVEFHGGMNAIIREKRTLINELRVERDDILEIDFDL